VLEVTCRVVAPLMPLTAEAIWRGLTGGRSVHLADWPLVDELPNDTTLVHGIDRVRQVCSSTLALRTSNRLRVRLPLAKLTIAASDADQLTPYVDLIKDEVNVKDVQLTTDLAAHGSFEITVNARAAGPRLGKDVQRVIKAVKAGQWTTSATGAVVADGIELLSTEYERRLVSKDVGAAGELPGSSGIVSLDTVVTPELEAEGVARDLVRAIQQVRRDAGLDVSDRIKLTIDAPEVVTVAARAHEGLIRSETLALDVGYGASSNGVVCKVGEGLDVKVGVAKVG
jgi:isoleucyl-tRNA synthetase